MRSYGIYLWHWPIFLLTWPKQPSLQTLAAQTFATVIIAALSYWLLETPIRRGALGRVWSDLRSWGSLRPAYQTGLILSANAVVAVIATLVILGAQAQPPDKPDYFALNGIRIQSNAGDQQTSQAWPVSSLVDNFAAHSSEPDPLSLSFVCPASVRPGTPLAHACGDPSVVSVAISDAEDVGRMVATDIEGALAEAAAEAPPPEKPPLVMPARRIVPASTPLVTAVGDSVMLGAASWLAGSIPNIDLDSQVGRQASAAIAILEDRLEQGQLGQIVLVHIGNNGTLSNDQFEQIMSIAGPDRQVIFVNTEVPRDWQDSNNAVLAAGAARHANVTLIDWHGITKDHPELFAKDHIHLNGAGAELYTRLIVDAVLGKTS